MMCSQGTLGLLLAVGFSVLGAVGCGGGEATTSTASSGSAATGSGGERGSAASTTGSGGASSSSSGAGGAAVMLGDVDVTVNYAGAQTGTLSVAALTSFPPMGSGGPPVAFQSIKMPMFSQKVTLTGLEAPKDYYIVAVLDIGNNNPMTPGMEDLVAVTMPAVKVVANKATAVELTLKDK